MPKMASRSGFSNDGKSLQSARTYPIFRETAVFFPEKMCVELTIQYVSHIMMTNTSGRSPEGHWRSSRADIHQRCQRCQPSPVRHTVPWCDWVQWVCPCQPKAEICCQQLNQQSCWLEGSGHCHDLFADPRLPAPGRCTRLDSCLSSPP